MNEAQKALSQLAKNRPKRDPKEFHTRLLVYRGRQFSLTMLVGTFVLVFTSFIFNDILLGTHWVQVAIPLTIAGVVLVLFPQTEEWEYRAWQTKSQQVERHFLD